MKRNRTSRLVRGAAATPNLRITRASSTLRVYKVQLMFGDLAPPFTHTLYNAAVREFGEPGDAFQANVVDDSGNVTRSMRAGTFLIAANTMENAQQQLVDFMAKHKPHEDTGENTSVGEVA